MYIVYISVHFLSVLQKLFQNFPNCFQNFIKFLRNFSSFPFYIFQKFFWISSNLSCDFSKTSRKKSEIFLKFQKSFSITFTKLFQNVSRIFFKFLENYFQFLGEITVNTRFFGVSSQLVHCSHFWTFLVPTFLKPLSELFQIFLLLRDFYAISFHLQFLKN